jgi:hypothetical protein
MAWFWENAVTLANLMMAAAAVAALIYAHLQIAEGRKAERQANANELWRENLRLAFENPKLSDPTLRLAEFQEPLERRASIHPSVAPIDTPNRRARKRA